MKRTFLFSILMLAMVSVFSLSISKNAFSSQSANSANLLPYFSAKILNGTTPVVGATVTVSGPSGTIVLTSNANGEVCTGQSFGTVRVSWYGSGKNIFGCVDINHQSQTMCLNNPYLVYCGSYCNEQ